MIAPPNDQEQRVSWPLRPIRCIGRERPRELKAGLRSEPILEFTR
jgi:hypothetical protein